MPFVLRPGDLTDVRVRTLLEEHIADMYAVSPPESVFTLDVDELAAANIRFVTVWEVPEGSTDTGSSGIDAKGSGNGNGNGNGNERIVGCGAMRLFTENGRPAGELKSMRTAEAGRRRGVAGLVLRALEGIAVGEGVEVLYLETGTEAFFAPARAFYERHGFRECGQFAAYGPDPLSYFMTKELPSTDRR